MEWKSNPTSCVDFPVLFNKSCHYIFLQWELIKLHDICFNSTTSIYQIRELVYALNATHTIFTDLKLYIINLKAIHV